MLQLAKMSLKADHICPVRDRGKWCDKAFRRVGKGPNVGGIIRMVSMLFARPFAIVKPRSSNSKKFEIQRAQD